MSIIGSSWKEEPTPEDQYKEATGNDFYGSKEELKKQLEKDINGSHTSRSERNSLRDLLNELNK